MTRTGTTASVSLPRTWGEYFPRAARLQIVVIVTLVLFVYWVPINRDMVWRWANDGNWSHGWLVPAFSLYFLLTRRDELFRIRPRPNYLGTSSACGTSGCTTRRSCP